MNRFEIIKDIDEGAFGFVQMARNKETGEIVAIKKIKKKYNSWNECMNLREIRSLKKLKNPNVIKLKEVFKLEQELFLVFEYARTNLFKFYSEEFKEKGKNMSEQLIKSLIFQAVSALVYIHKQGFFHRDMKPENLLITDRQVLKIADFGLAREIRSSPPYTEYVSTRWYRSPEILLKSTNYNSPVDIWALGCIMAELYLNGPLFNGASETDQLAKICAVLGYPGKSWPEGIRLASQNGFCFPNHQPLNLEDVIKNASPMAIDMMKSMLNYDSSKRPTAIKLLSHPYFNQTTTSSVTELPFPTPISTGPLKKSIFEVMKIHSQLTDHPTSNISKKNLQQIPNIYDELENSWYENSNSSSKACQKNLQTPKSKHRLEELFETKPNVEPNYDDSQFQKKLDSVFPERFQQIRFEKESANQKGRQETELEEEKLKLNITAKKKQFDVELEELEKQILATKKKFQSPFHQSQNQECREISKPESAISKKTGILYNQNKPENLKKPANLTNCIFNDQLEELLTKEQHILEQKSIKNFEVKAKDVNMLKKNAVANKKNTFDYQHEIRDVFLSSNLSNFAQGTLANDVKTSIYSNQLTKLGIGPKFAPKISNSQN